MGGYGGNLFQFIRNVTSLTLQQFEQIWNQQIYPNLELQEKYNGIWCKIALQEEIFTDIIPRLVRQNVAASYSARSAGIFILISCIDAIAGDRYQDLYTWLRARHQASEYTQDELPNYYEEYLNECGGMRNFRAAFQHFIELRLIDNYAIYFSRQAQNFFNRNQEVRGKIMTEIKQRYEASSEIEKCNTIGRFFYTFYRNPFVHKGHNPSHGIPDWAAEAMGRANDTAYMLPFIPEIQLIGGHIRGDVVANLRELIRILLARKFESYEDFSC